MKLTLSHQKNPAVGWDVSASAATDKSDGNEKIVRAQIIVDDFPEYDETFASPLSNWQKQLTQQGQFPGNNKVRLIVTNDKGENVESEDEWG
ncbi:MAG: hypothetical protein WB729_22535 [Candidatus Sulfotelmatobacter sp.]